MPAWTSSPRHDQADKCALAGGAIGDIAASATDLSGATPVKDRGVGWAAVASRRGLRGQGEAFGAQYFFQIAGITVHGRPQ